MRVGKDGDRNVLDDLRSDDLAGTAPGGEEVNDHEALLAESGVEVGLAVNHVESVFCLVRARGWRKCGRARTCSCDLRGEVMVVLLLMLVMLLSKVREWKVVVVADLNADVGGVRLRWSAELARVRERIREADMEAVCGWGLGLYMSTIMQ